MREPGGTRPDVDLRARIAEFDSMHSERIYWNDVCWAFDAVERVLDLCDELATHRGGHDADVAATVRAALLGES